MSTWAPTVTVETAPWIDCPASGPPAAPRTCRAPAKKGDGWVIEASQGTIMIVSRGRRQILHSHPRCIALAGNCGLCGILCVIGSAKDDRVDVYR